LDTVVFFLLVLVIIYALTLLDGIQEKATAGIRNKFSKMNGNYTELGIWTAELLS